LILVSLPRAFGLILSFTWRTRVAFWGRPGARGRLAAKRAREPARA
jgi:hypothetical protein